MTYLECIMVSLRWGGAMGWNPGRHRPNSSYTAICWCRAGPGFRLICSGILWAWYVRTSVLQYLQDRVSHHTSFLAV